MVHVDTCSSDFIVDVLCEVKERDLRGDYIRPFLRPSSRPSVLLYCGPVSRKQVFVKMGAVTATLHVRATIKFDQFFLHFSTNLGEIRDKVLPCYNNNEEVWFSEMLTVINDENQHYSRILYVLFSDLDK